jgi:ADP-heptose:LPS heptosyltransferase
MAASERGNLLLRTLDRYVGIPLVRCAGLCRKPSPPPTVLNTIGVLCLGCIGDMVLLSGPLSDMAREQPHARLTIFCSKANMDAARMVPGATEVIVLPVKNPFKAAVLVHSYGPFDAWLDSSQWPRLGAMLSLAARARHKVGFMSPGQHRHQVYDTAVPHSRERHELDNFRALTAPLGIAGRALPRLVPPPMVEADLPGGSLPDGPYAVLHMYPGGYHSFMKQWPQENWRLLAQNLLARGLQVVLSGGPADHEGNEGLVRAAGSPHVRNFAGVRVGPTALLLQHASVTISVNTGIMHLAAAMGAPLVSLNGPVSVDRWGPVTRPGCGVALRSTRACAPCLHLGFEYACQDNACMRDISVAAVLEAIELLLARRETP